MEEVDVLSRTESKQLKKQKYVDAMGPLSRGIKRLMDILAAISGMIVFSPLIFWCYLAVKKEDGGPAIFSQERIGYKGKPFVLYKFRSMCIDSEASGPQLYAQGDSRLTKVGRFIREHHLDELPQLWNLLKGDMSMVGYRPERMFYIEQIMEHNPDYEYLYQIQPGLFSYATLYNGYCDTIEKMLERLRLDLEYITNRTLWTDIKIIYRTITSILIGKKF